MIGLKGIVKNSRIDNRLWKYYLRFVSSSKRASIEYFGNEKFGWNLCPQLINKKSTIYSAGVGTDISFDLDVINRFRCNVNLFDPTPAVKEWIKGCQLPDQLNYFDYGLSDKKGDVVFFPPKSKDHISHSAIYSNNLDKKRSVVVKMSTLMDIMGELSHSHIDLLKLDIEGSEYGVIESVVRDKIPVTQLLVEYHHRFSAFSFTDTKRSIKSLLRSGFEIYSISDSGNELLFVK